MNSRAFWLAVLGLCVALPAPAAWQVVHRWTFESPAPYDDSVGAAHLTASASGVSLVASGDATLGQAARVVTSGNLTAPQAALAAIGTNAFQLRFWVKREAANISGGLLDTLNGTDTGFQLFFQANNTLRLRLDDSSGSTANFDSTNTVLADSRWHEVVLTVNRSLPAGLVFAVDGATEPPLNPGAVPGTISPSQNLFLGNLNGTSPLLGQLAEVEISVNPPVPPPFATFTPAPGFSRGPIVVSLAASDPAATIRYTVDGSEPGLASPLFTAPLPIAASTEVRARAWLEGVAGPETDAAYTIASNPPNVVLFIAEDVGAGDLHAYGNPVHATPNLDQLCRDGVRFTQSYCAGPGNAPNQYAALTARLLPRSGLPPFIAPGSGTGLASREWTVAEAFLKAGWHTAFIGGWHLGDATASLPHRQGFQLFNGLIMPQEGAPLANLRENDMVLEAAPNPANLLGQFVTRVLSFLDVQGTNRFLLVLQVPPLPASGSSLGGSYGNRIEALDDAVGQLTTRLATLGLRESTLFLFLSDEGPNLTAPLPRGSSGMFLDGRGTVFEGGVRVPAVASWPGVILPGRVSQAVWWLPDLPPTLCGMAGLCWPGDRPMDGTNRAAAVSGAALASTGSEALFFHRLTGPAPNLVAQRLGAVKYHRSITKTDPENSYTTAPLIFDVERDPTERFNGLAGLAASVPQLDASAAAHLATYQPPYPQVPPQATLITGFAATTGPGSEPPMRLSFHRAADALDEYYHLDQSTDLLTWTSVPLTSCTRQTIKLSADSEQVTVRPPSWPGVNQVFYRLRATLP